MACAVLLPVCGLADDIRADTVIHGAGAGAIPYVATLSDCDSVARAEAGGQPLTLVRDASRGVCEARFHASGAQRLSPSVQIYYRDGSSRTLQESYPADDQQPPVVSLEGLAIEGDGDSQRLIVTLNASDNVDLRYLTANVLGIRASVLSAAGGVVSAVEDQAFAAASGARLYPLNNTQTQFQYVVPLRERLGAEAIASDAMVVLDVAALDAHGNQGSYSRVGFVGGQISERVESMAVMPNRLVITHPLQTPALVPVVNFQFRGEVALPGAGAGVSYSSSDPSLVGVSSGGVVFPVAETQGMPVTITVSYPGAEPIQVPVSVDFSVTINELVLEDVDEDNPFVIPRLNQFVALPALFARLSDGDQVMVPENWRRALTLVDARGVLDVNGAGMMRARGELDGSQPGRAQLTVPEIPGLSLAFPVHAHDAPPTVSVQAPARAEVGDEVLVQASASDDVGVARVDFLIDGAPVSSVTRAPYRMTLPIPHSLLGKTLSVTALAEDTAGQRTLSDAVALAVDGGPPPFVVPGMEIILPRDGQRAVESTPLKVQIERHLGDRMTEPDMKVRQIQMFLDGQQAGQIVAARFETRQVAGLQEEQLFEVWRGEVTLPSTSAAETSVGFSARMLGAEGEALDLPGQLIRVIRNRPPSAQIMAPVEGAAVTAGNSVRVQAQVADDAGPHGVRVELLERERVVATRTLPESDQGPRDALDPVVSQISFDYSTDEDDIGRQLALSVRVTDYHGAVFRTEPRLVSVVGDQPPTVAISHPAEGSAHVGGLPLEIRAQAVDDVGVTRVEFLVDGRLVGTAYQPPYRITLPTEPVQGLEQRLTLTARAFDTAGQQADAAPVHVLLGHDEIPPVVNLASPVISETSGGLDLAPVIENEQFVFKLTGYDNVGVTRLEVQGLSRAGDGQALLTGQASDVLDQNALPLQALAGTANGYSAAAIVRAPAFSGSGTQDIYQLRATVWDDTGNSSTLNVGVVVRADQPPTIVRVQPDKPAYVLSDTLRAGVQAVDDRGVHQLHYRLLNGGTVLQQGALVAANGDFVAMRNLQHNISIPVPALDLPNARHTLALEVTAYDSIGQASEPVSAELVVREDNEAPVINLTSPLPQSNLVAGSTTIFQWTGSDDNGLAGLRVTRADGVLVHERSLSGQQMNGQFSVSVPESGDTLTLLVRSEDIYGNVAERQWEYRISVDEPPVIEIRQPAPGLRVVEGEMLDVNFTVSDDRGVQNARVRIERDGQIEFEKVFSSQQVNAAINAGQFLHARLPVPTRPEQGEQFRFVVMATDTGNQTTTRDIDIVIVDDDNPPDVQMTKPASDLSRMPGDTIEISGTAVDDIHVDRVEVILRASQGDNQGEVTVLPWDGNLIRSDEIEEIRQPNPGSFGTTIVGRRHVTTFKGRVRLPASFVDHAGEHFDLLVRATDKGVNTGESPSRRLTVLADEEAPSIQMKKPGSTVVERTDARLDIQITDNIALASVRVFLITDGSELLYENTSITGASYHIAGVDIPLDSLLPVGPEGHAFTLRVEATDTSGNESVHMAESRLLPDQPPQVSVLHPQPAQRALAGSVAYRTLELRDDAPDDGISLLPIMTSMVEQGRAFTGVATMVNEVLQPRVRWTYPEAAASPQRLRLGGQTLLVLDAEAELAPLASLNGALVLESTQAVTYRIRQFWNDPCQAETVSAEHESYTLNLNDWLGANVARVEITPLYDGEETQGEQPLRRLVINTGQTAKLNSYTSEGRSHSVRGRPQLLLELRDAQASGGWSELQVFGAIRSTQATSRHGVATTIPVRPAGVRDMYLLAHAIDRFSDERGPIPLSILQHLEILPDEQAPGLQGMQPQSGTELVQGQVVPWRITVDDNTGVAQRLALTGADGNLLFEQTGLYGQGTHEFQWQVPANISPGLLSVFLQVEDPSGHRTAEEVLLPIRANAPPAVKLTAFSSYRVGSTYRRHFTDEARLALNEFWVRSGEPFRLGIEATDDTGLESLTLIRLLPGGGEHQERRWDFPFSCPDQPVRRFSNSADVTFDQTEPTEYVLRATDRHGRIRERRFIVNPESNVAPEIRIVTPGNNQIIAAGTFAIQVGVVASDDRALTANNFAVYANGVLLSASVVSNEPPGGEGAVLQAFNSIYDSFEHNYSIDVANEHGRRTSANAIERMLLLELPAGIAGQDTSITITATVTDSDGAAGTHEIMIDLAPDDILPEAILSRPTLGDRLIEAAFVDLHFSAYDNVKVDSIELYTAYGAQHPDGYVMGSYGAPVRSVTDIPAKDHNPITTQNIDTPNYVHRKQLARMPQIAETLDVVLAEVERVDMWVRMVVRDASGNTREREVSFPVRIDERPVVDVVEPLPGSRQVESAPLYVNVNAYDDVAIDSVRLTATRGGVTFYNVPLRQPPYAFSVPLPAYDAANPSNNIVDLHVEAIDSYGAAYGDLDNHTATESVQIEIVEDLPPVVVIASPANGSSLIEGQALLVEVNATDDLGVDRVALSVSGLITGERTIIDYEYPYEFLINVPYGQAGTPITLTAAVTEQRAANPRTVMAPDAVVVHVEADDEAPEVDVLQPASAGATAVEGRPLPFRVEARDNVRVTSVLAELLIDLDRDGTVAEHEVTDSIAFVAAPYQSAFTLRDFSHYFGAAAEEVSSVAARLRITARDGAGNVTIEQVPLTILRNQPPEVTAINILDSRGFSLGSAVSEITEGRRIIVAVEAEDLESGVERVTLYRALGEGGALTEVGTDVSAPFQFNVNVPLGRVGDTLVFRAIAEDVDGKVSALSAPRQLTITADQPPTAEIIQPANDLTAVIRGEAITVSVRATDDLGTEGIEKVVFLMNDVPAYTAWQSVSANQGTVAQEDIYRATLTPPDGSKGVTLQAVAYDIHGQTGSSQVVRVGVVEDTVRPRVEPLTPADGDVLTGGEPVRIAVAVNDIGDDARRVVVQDWIREYRDQNGDWVTLAETRVPLVRNDAREPGDTTPVSDPNNYYYIYWADFANGALLRRDMRRDERVRVMTRVTTDNHEVIHETLHEIGLPLDRRRHVIADMNAATPTSTERSRARDVYYSAVDQFRGPERTGALMTAWNTLDPILLEGAMGVPSLAQLYPGDAPAVMRTGLFMLDAMPVVASDGYGREYLYSSLLNSASEVFAGAITRLHSDENVLLAAKMGLPHTGVEAEGDTPFLRDLERAIERDEDTGARYYNNLAGELLLFSTRNAEGQFGLPYSLAGRVDMPFPEVLGVARSDNMVLVANGHGGVQAVDISNFNHPYRVGFIKPHGFARDVLIHDGFAFIAASEEGVVIADITDPALPIVARFDTLGIANRLALQGDRLYVTNMGADGRTAELTILDVRHPLRPTLHRNIQLTPARGDHAPDGVYDIMVAGNLAYATLMLSDQEDRPARSMIEIIELGQDDSEDRDITVPVITHAEPHWLDFAVRGVTLANGAVEIAAARGGVARLQLAELTVVQHQPGNGARQVSSDLEQVRIELSSVLDPASDLAGNVRVYRGELPFGEDISETVSVAFGTREGEEARRFIEVRAPEAGWQAGETYTVEVRTGLIPMASDTLTMSSPYRFRFHVSQAGAEAAPDILDIVPASGDVSGGTRVMLRGTGFGDQPRVTLGQLEAIVETVNHDPDTGRYSVEIITPPNYAGPAAVRVQNAAGLEDVVLGGFRYVDALRISFIEPGVVSTRQDGEGDRVNVVGFGFHPGVTLHAWPSNQPQNSRTDQAGSDRLRLESAERMSWAVPDFGEAYRGFLDVEVRDDAGRRFWVPRALFYGKLDSDRVLSPLPPMQPDADALPPDSLRLPPGRIMDLAADSELGLIYVLGRGLYTDNTPGQGVLTQEAFLRTQPPGWISLVHYQRDRLDEAAPMHGFGYMNLPQSLSPVAMHLSDTQLYVSAQGLPFSYIDVPYEGLPHLLVYERESRIPGGDQQPEARDRDLLYALPLPLAQAPQQLLQHGNLLIAPASDGVAILNIANPLRPGVVQVLRRALVNGAEIDLRPLSAHLENDRLVVDAQQGNHSVMRIVYDLSRPGAPQLSAAPIAAGRKGSVHLRPWMAIAQGGNLSLHDTQQSVRPPMLGVYQPSGFDIPGNVSGLALGNSLAAIQYRYECAREGNTRSYEYHVQLLDISRPADVMFLDAMRTFDCNVIRDRYGARPGLTGYSPRLEPVMLTDDGILVTAEESLRLTDTLVLDLATALPLPGAENVSLDTPIRLNFTHPVPVSGQESEHAYLSRYLSMLKDDGSADGVPVSVTLRRAAGNPRVIEIVPDAVLTAQTRYRVTLEADLAARRTEGLFDFSYTFTTGDRLGEPVRILGVDTPFLPISGGPLTVRVAYPGDASVFLVAGEPAAIADSEWLDTDTMRYTLEAPAAAAPGAASLAVVTTDGSRDNRPGSVIYVEPLVLNSIAPAIGNVDGGTTVTLKGRGLRADAGRVRVFFGNTEADAATVRLIDSDTLTVTAPAGALGRVDVRVQQDDGQSATLARAFEYRQPPQANIPVEAQVRDLVIDPTGTWAVAATSEGVMIVNIAASTWTGRGDNPLLPADLLSMIDENGNERDDRIEALVPLPDGWQAQRIALSFERGSNRVLVTAHRNTGGEDQGALFILAFDPLDISQSTVVRELALPGNIARGLIAGGNRALVTLGSAGVGIVDTYLHTRAFLQAHMPLPGAVPALDIAALPRQVGTAEHYVVVGGRMDPATQRLLDVQQPGSRGFYVVGNDPAQGLHVVSSLDILGTTVSVSGHLAIVAAGDGGMVLVDVSDPTQPVIRGRVSDIGYVRDVSVLGHVVYVISDQGALAFDISNPAAPQRLHGQMAGDWQ
ncbi:MAG: hypothetical protein C0462_05360, partial [Alcanivorax sp.]|nr:hypothetical protein [Alcanivorax sp.]